METTVEYPKPWEKGYQFSKEQADAPSRRPWEAEIPPVPPEILQAHHDHTMATGQGLTIKKIEAEAFAREYVIDFDPVNAMVRSGLATGDEGVTYFTNRCGKILRNPYTLQALKAIIGQVEKEKIVSRERILMGLLEEANYRGPGASPSARVAAWAKLAKLMGMELPDADPSRDNGGVILIPFADGGIEAWEAAAINQQAKLKADVRT